MNDRFAAKTSRDIRDTLTMKRRKGEFIDAFAPYGYQKDQKNKNRLILEEEAAKTVRDIFHWLVECQLCFRHFEKPNVHRYNGAGAAEGYQL